jgi:methyl-accepting chemotaxis protein
MFRFLNGVSDRVKLLAPVALCTLALVGVGWFAWTTVDRVKVGGPIDADIINGKDLMADVLPPPMYLVETHLTVQETAGVSTPKKVDAFVTKYTALRKEYDDRQAYWVKTLPPGPARDLVTGPLSKSAKEYFDICEQQLVPALKANDEKKAKELANGVLKEKYAAQRAVVDQVVKLATDENEARSKEAAETVRWNMWCMLALLVGVPLVAGVLSLVIVRQVTGKTQAALAEAGLTQAMMDSAQTNVMFADRELVIRYVNPMTVRTLQKLEQHLPVKATELVGKSIDLFHKRPDHQRRVLSDPSAVSPVSLIQVGPEQIELRVSPVFDKDRNHLGTMVTWDVVTERLTVEENNRDQAAQLAAISKAQAVIEFRADGVAQVANDNFLSTMGYTLAEIQGRHHSMFVDPAYSGSPEYREFWSRLGRGEAVAADFRRYGKGGKEVWIRASYNPITDASGKVTKVIKFATDITSAKMVELQAHRDAEVLKQKVDAIVGTVNSLASGDFTQQIPDLGTDVVGQMAVALNKAILAVRTALEGVCEVSEQLADASGQLAAASEEIASGAQEQASSLEETASTLEEITATVRQNSDSAQQARQLASGSRDVAEKGGQVVGTAVEAMDAINQSSKKIADIITTIDEIAFQTNLLALNAAVEAARAGEQGRGFAVVAAEVRNLAQRSATAAKEIKGLINDSVKKVDAGTDLVNKSGATLGEIVTSVKRVTDIVTEIAAASREQSTGIDQVNKAVTQMDSVTQRNASQTEEMSATAQTLTEQAGQLRDLVSRFKLSSGGGSVSHHTPPPRKLPAAKRPRPAVAKAIKNGHANGTGKHELDDLSGGDDGYTEF